MSSMTDMEAGQWIAKVEALTKAVDRLSQKLEGLEKQAAYGRGVLWGMLSVAGAVGAGISWLAGRMWP